MRIAYRVRQFWLALMAAPRPEDLERARERLSPQLMALFLQMQPGEQAHSLDVYARLLSRQQTDTDLLTAALLHDVGKSRYPLHVWDRAAIVLARKLFREQAQRWGQAAPRGWRRPFVVAEQHPAWGAEMASQAGASALTVRLIRRHQDPVMPGGGNGEEALLYQLQCDDDAS